MVIFFPLPSRTAGHTTAAPRTVGVPTVVPRSVDTISTSVSSTVAPGSTESFSTLTTSPGETRSCFPPVRTTAYIGHSPPSGSIRTNHYRERGFPCQLRNSRLVEHPPGKPAAAVEPAEVDGGILQRIGTCGNGWGGGDHGRRRHRRRGTGRDPAGAPVPGARGPAQGPRAGEGRAVVGGHAPRGGPPLSGGPRHRLDLPDPAAADLGLSRCAAALSDPRGFTF